MSESEIKEGLNRVLAEHQHESGLHVVGGRRRLIDRLAEFLEEMKKEDREPGLVGGRSR